MWTFSTRTFCTSRTFYMPFEKKENLPYRKNNRLRFHKQTSPVVLHLNSGKIKLAHIKVHRTKGKGCGEER